MSNLDKAVKTYLHRQSRECHPNGKFDKAGRWYPSEDEECECCSNIRNPSRAYPYSLILHCRSIKHVASLYGVEDKELRKSIKGRK